MNENNSVTGNKILFPIEYTVDSCIIGEAELYRLHIKIYKKFAEELENTFHMNGIDLVFRRKVAHVLLYNTGLQDAKRIINSCGLINQMIAKNNGLYHKKNEFN